MSTDLKVEYFTIEPEALMEWQDPDGERDFAVYAHGTYGRSSVLGGQYGRQFRDSFPTIAEAKAAYPKADVVGGSTRREHQEMPHCAPSWFDPSAAGERWDDNY